MLNVYRFKYHFCHVIHICTHANRYECIFFAASEYTTNQPTNQHTSFQFLMLQFAVFVLSSYPYIYSRFSLCLHFTMIFPGFLFFQWSISFPFQCIFPHVCCIFFYKLEIFSFFSLFVSYCGIIF